MRGFVTLTEVGPMSGQTVGEITVSVDSIESFKEDPGYGTDISFKNRKPITVREKPSKILELIGLAQ